PDLPQARRRPTGPVRFTRREHRVAAGRWADLKKRAAAASLTPTGLLVAVFAEVLRTWSTSDRFTINLPLFNRLPLHPDIDQVIGDFTTTSLLAVEKADGVFEQRAKAVQRQMWRDLEHRHFNGVRVMRELATRSGSPARAAFPIVVTSLLGQPPRHLHTALGEAVYTSTQTPQVTLDFQVSEAAGELRMSWDSIDEAFPPGLIADMFSAYVGLLDRLAEDADAWHAPRFDLVPEHQMAVRRAVNATAAPVPDRLLHQAVAEHAAARPEHPAIVDHRVRLDYAEFSRRVNQVGRRLRELGARPNTLVAVVAEKGWQQVVAAHGVLAAGAAYLPIDPGVPAERLRRLLAHGEVSLALTTAAQAGLAWPDGVRTLRVESDFADVDPAPLDLVQRPADLAYVIYTSGSTGEPKGVMVDHRGAMNTIADINGRLGIGPGDRCLAVSGLHFDLSVYDVFGMVAAGGTVVLPRPSDHPDPAHWADLVARERITFWNSVPALLEMVVDLGRPLDSLRTVILAGDFIPVDLPDRLRALAPRTRVIASGGPTETCVWSIINPLGEVDTTLPSIPYGKPMANQRYHILDGRLAHRPTWVPGEIHIASEVGLARGYWRDPELTAAKFFPLPGEEERVYASGDLGRYLPDGSIEILGRTDFQVKINGHRIELGEIEAALTDHPAVEHAVVVVAEPKRLVGHVVAAGVTAEELRAHVAALLPAPMVPEVIKVRDGLPLTGNGKVDRLALAREPVTREQAAAPPQGPVEETVAAVWCELLGVPEVGRQEHFFRLGGDSLSATKIAARLSEMFGVEVPLRLVLTEPTIAGFTAALLADPDRSERVTAVCAALAELVAAE
ncbi:MAG: amino acid adenylation domain-containing protein, partial [Microbispora sp.]|nr:amino acid adenylation domain-containing protein [Microbispora sp.]